MKNTVIFTVFFLMVFCAASAQAQYTYWIAYTNTTGAPDMANSVAITSLSDGNNIWIDYDHDGVAEDEFLDVADGAGVSRSQAPATGTKIISDLPLQVTYYYSHYDDGGAYEDSALQHGVLAERSVGDEYYLPIDFNNYSVMAIIDGTAISYDADNDGTPDDTFNLGEGEAHRFAAVAGSHLWANNDFYIVAANHPADSWDMTSAFPVLPVRVLGNHYVAPPQHPYNHYSSVDQSGVYIVAAQDGLTVNIDTNQQAMDAGDVWYFPTTIETEITSDGPIFAAYLSRVYGEDHWRHVYRNWDFAFVLAPASLMVQKLYTRGGETPQGSPQRRFFVASHADNNQVDFYCVDGSGSHTLILNEGEAYTLDESDGTITCWLAATMRVTASEPVHASYSYRGWWAGVTEKTFGSAYLGLYCNCSLDEHCDDGLWCSGEETCVDCQCVDGEEPCPVDDGLWCNGGESCDEDNDDCPVTDPPCPDDGLFCTGVESCDEDGDACLASGDPCADDGEFCNGSESCDEEAQACVHSGDPCANDGLFCNGEEYCDVETQQCVTPGNPCPDDGDFCNGGESCDEEAGECAHAGDPCSGDGLFCNGEEYCDIDTQQCVTPGDPCPEDETCDEESNRCISGNSPVDPGDEDEGWPEGKVTGGCCGCE
jgi:IgGFc binding protein